MPGKRREVRRRFFPRGAHLVSLAGLLPLLLLARGAGAEVPSVILGTMVHQAKVGDFFIHYHLLDKGERDLLMQDVKGRSVPGIDASGRVTHHLMAYIWGPDGRIVPAAQVTFRVEAPDGRVSATPAASMKGGYGADISLGPAGSHRVSMSANIGSRTLQDEFTFEFK